MSCLYILEINSLSVVLFISVIVLLIDDCLFFVSSRFLYKACIFLFHASSLFICAPLYLQDFRSSLLSILWILFQVDCPFFSSFIWSCGFLPCSFICMFLCLFILFNLLCLGSPFCRLKDYSSSYFWSLSPVGEVGPVSSESFPLGLGDWCLCSGGWSWISSLWKARPCIAVCWLSVSLVYLWAGQPVC